MAEHFLTGYINKLAKLMGVDNWHITIRHGSTDDISSYAETTLWDERFRADIVLRADWEPSSKEELREILAHEVIHLHFAALDQAFQSTKELLGKPLYLAVGDRYRTDREKAVQQIAHFWAPYLPLPPRLRES